jgi:protocatechuate 3,4-dioxygenase beta subunit
MHLDDRPVGRLFSRREALAALGAGGLVLLAGCSREGAARETARASGPCIVRPELTEGPYYVDEELNRSDIRPDPSDGTVKDGALLALTLNVSRLASGGCSPLAGALVDVWHCDALGVYSDVTDPGFDTRGKKFLRGHQITGPDGVAKFTTIYPGWYPGRTVHIHFKVRSPAGASRAYEFTSQLFFDDSLTDRVHARQPYAVKSGRRLRNSGDRIYRQGGEQLVLDLQPDGSGYASAFALALQHV